jgi:hypothetical protein
MGMQIHRISARGPRYACTFDGHRLPGGTARMLNGGCTESAAKPIDGPT